MFFALEIALGLRPRAIPRAETIFHGMSLLSSTYCISMIELAPKQCSLVELITCYKTIFGFTR